MYIVTWYVNRGHTLDVEAEAKFKRLRPRPRLNLKRPNRTLYFTVTIYAVKHSAIANAISRDRGT